MGAFVRRIRFQNKGQNYTMRCHFCKRPKTELYQAVFEEGGNVYLLCPGNCMKIAQHNFQEKKAQGISFVPEGGQADPLNDIQRASLEGEDNILNGGEE